MPFKSSHQPLDILTIFGFITQTVYSVIYIFGIGVNIRLARWRIKGVGILSKLRDL